jgi:hypothetical protein
VRTAHGPSCFSPPPCLLAASCGFGATFALAGRALLRVGSALHLGSSAILHAIHRGFIFVLGGRTIRPGDHQRGSSFLVLARVRQLLLGTRFANNEHSLSLARLLVLSQVRESLAGCLFGFVASEHMAVGEFGMFDDKSAVLVRHIV